VQGHRGSWSVLFLRLELAFLLPASIYSVYRLLGSNKGTTGPLELLLLVHGFQSALTTGVCLYDIDSWDPVVYPADVKSVFFYQMFGPWFVACESSKFPPFADMRTRTLTILLTYGSCVVVCGYVCQAPGKVPRRRECEEEAIRLCHQLVLRWTGLTVARVDSLMPW